MNRRNFFKMFGGAIAAAALPLGALALPRREFCHVDVREWGLGITDVELGLDDFENRILNLATQRLAAKIDNEMMELLK